MESFLLQSSNEMKFHFIMNMKRTFSVWENREDGWRSVGSVSSPEILSAPLHVALSRYIPSYNTMIAM